VLGTLPTEKKPNAIIFDPATRRVFVAVSGGLKARENGG